jgi:hypothetical protein
MPRNRDFQRNIPRITTEEVTITGELTILHGMLSIVSEGTTYLVAGLDRYIGFIDELKYGASVSLEGSAISLPQQPDTKMLRVSKMTLGGKDYDIGMVPLRGMTPNVQPRDSPRDNNSRDSSPRSFNSPKDLNRRDFNPQTPQRPMPPGRRPQRENRD